MKRCIVFGMFASLAATTVQAQGGAISPKCVAGVTQDACQKAIDMFQYMAPQLGIAMTGGNATLGQGGTLGGFGHFVVSARVNGLIGSLPQIDKVAVQTTGAQSDAYPTKNQILGLPQVDASIGVFQGIPLGITNVGGIDLLVSASYLPSVNNSSVNVSVPNGSLKLGYGARIGIFQESIILPGVSVTYLRRDLPTVDIAASTSGGDSLLVNGLDVQTSAWRVVANKSLLLFGVAAGVGRDNYSSGTAVRANVGGTSSGAVDVSQKLTRTNYFLDVSLNIPLFKVVGEIGQVSGGTVNTYNSFDGKRADASRLYGSVGLRFGL